VKWLEVDTHPFGTQYSGVGRNNASKRKFGRHSRRSIEIGGRYSVEDLLNAPQFILGPEYSRRTGPEPGLRGSNGGRGSSSGRYGPQSIDRNGPGGKYFVVKANTSSSSRHGRPLRQTSVESLSAQSKQTVSLENMASSQSNSQRPLAHVRARTGDERSKRDSCEVKRRSGAFTRTGSMRRGSLDSLIDLLEKRDNRMSWASTDSEEGYDLLTTLTSTFDQKLQTLSSAKLMQSAAAKAARRWRADSMAAQRATPSQQPRCHQRRTIKHSFWPLA